MLFPFGKVVATPGALAALERSEQGAREFLRRHGSGDWGGVREDDAEANERALKQGLRVLSVYETRKGDRLWIITEADRSSTCLLLPEEY